MDALSLAQARRIALAAQGFADPRPPGRVDRRHVRRVLDRVGLIQIDSVNVLVRSQELPLFARLGPHDRALLPRLSAAGELFEYWGHEASLIPSERHRLFRWRMEAGARGETWDGIARLARERPGLVDQVLRSVAERGPVAARDLTERARPKGAWWDWDDTKRALEFLFWSGRLAARRRASDFARLYDLPERVLPADALALDTPPESEARKALLLLAARSLGVATARDLADYHRQRLPAVRPLLAELVEQGALRAVAVEGWAETGYLHPEARAPRRVRARALLSPFDSLVWERARAERLYGFRYRVEIYVPAPRRVHGYYVLPFLLGERLVARCDLKADRAAGALLVRSAWGEPGAPAGTAHELAAELRLMAGWLGLAGIEVADRGDLAPALRREVAAAR
jgi:hypothetical protein